MKRIVSVLLCAIMLLSLVACGTHEHTFDKTVQSQQYLKEAGCADKKAVYFYSCDCGEKGTETFEGDFGADHNYAAFLYKKDSYIINHYLNTGKESNFIDIMDSATEMEGIQKLIDRYIDMQTYLYY